MRHVRVKICGLTREADVASAVDAGADAVGFICGFPESPRNISLARAGELMKRVPPFVERVLVTRAELLDSEVELVSGLGIGAIQVYGRIDDPEGLRAKTNARLIIPRLMDGRQEVGLGLARYDAILSDTYRAGMQGGTGEVSDWEACRAMKEMISPTPFILSGGLNPTNVEDAIRKVEPYAVDVSSGVEASPGIKDQERVRAFVDKVVGSA